MSLPSCFVLLLQCFTEKSQQLKAKVEAAEIYFYNFLQYSNLLGVGNSAHLMPYLVLGHHKRSLFASQSKQTNVSKRRHVFKLTAEKTD